MRPHGFTLIELLVVIAIISILSVLSFAVVTNSITRARDGRRIADINTIANSMEAHLNNTPGSGCTGGTVGQYCALDGTFFTSQQIPQDPLNSSTSTPCNQHECFYCSKSSGSSAGNCTTGDGTVGSGVPAAGASYLLCANLETYNGPGGKDYYCRSNQQ